MTKMILGTLALVALLIPTTASAAAPNGMPDTTVENLTELAFSFSAGPFTDSRTNVRNCRKRGRKAWRCEATYRWRPRGAMEWSNVCQIRLKVWNRGGYANRRDVAACDGLVEADTTPRVAS